jgi:hypothetical protein
MEEELRMLINLALGVADQEKKLAALTERVELLHRNQLTLMKSINDIIEGMKDAANKKGK